MTAEPGPEPTFDLDHYLRLPRVAGLALAPDGRRLVTSVATPAPDGKKFRSALWELDPDGQAAPRRLTRSAPGEANAAFLPDGSLLFTSAREDAEAAPDAKPDGEVARLWLLPAGGGEARPVATTPAGIDLLRVARDAGTVVYRTDVHHGADDLEADERRDKARGDAGVSALLFETYPIRYWDHYLGARAPRLFAAAPPDGDQRMAPGRPLTPAPGRALDEIDVAVTPDGATVVCGWDTGEVTNPRSQLVAIDVASGERRVLLDDPGSSAGRVACSPDGRLAVCERIRHGDPGTALDVGLWLVDLDSGEGRDLAPGLELWPLEPVWAADSRAVFFVADENGRTPVFRVEVGGEGDGRLTRLSADGAFSDLCPDPGGRRLYALRTTMAAPAEAVALDTAAADPRPAPGRPRLPGRGRDPGRRRHPAAGLAGPALRRLPGPPGPAGGVHPRRAAVVLVGVELALEPVAASRPRLRRAASRPGPVDRLRPVVRGAGPGPLGGGALHRPDGPGRRGRGPPQHRPGADGGHGRVVRRLHGQLGRRPDRPLPLHHHPRQHLVAGAVPRHHRPRRLVGAGVRPARDDARALPGQLPRPQPGADPHAHAGHPRRARPPGADQRGPAPVDRPDPHRGRGKVPLLPRREPLDPHPTPCPDLVRDGAGLPRPARARQGLGPARAALTPGGRVLDPSKPAHARARRRLASERVVWLTTVRADGQAQSSPVWFLWDGETFLIYSQPDAQKVRNLTGNAKVSLHLSDDGAGEDIVTVEGTAAVDPDTPRADRLDGYLAKYQAPIEALGYEPGQFARTYSTPIRVRPTRVRAW